MKVFALIKETYNEVDELETDFFLFKTIEKAQQKMSEIFNIWAEPLRDEWGTKLTDVYHTEYTEKRATIQIKEYEKCGDLVDNLYLTIEEKEIED